MSNAMMSQRKAKERKAKQTSTVQSNLPENQVRQQEEAQEETQEEQLTGTGMEEPEKKTDRKPVPFSGDYEKISREKEAAREEEKFKLVSALINKAKKNSKIKVTLILGLRNISIKK